MINYPFGINKITEEKTKRSDISYGNRGMSLEKEINESNDYYRLNNLALIYKKPTPIKVIKINKNNPSLIEKAVFEKKSTTDYNGIFMGKYLDFEAKETTSTTSFPTNNLKDYQFEHLNKVSQLGGIAFIIIYFSKLDEYYLLKFENYRENLNIFKKSSIKIDYIRKYGYKIKRGLNPPLDYLKIIKDIICSCK